jgi:flagellin-like hook-associated protein FlgL
LHIWLYLWGNSTIYNDSIKISKEIEALGDNILRVSTETKFSGKNILDGSVITTTIQENYYRETKDITNVNLKTAAQTLTGKDIDDASTITRASTMTVDTNSDVQATVQKNRDYTLCYKYWCGKYECYAK